MFGIGGLATMYASSMFGGSRPFLAYSHSHQLGPRTKKRSHSLQDGSVPAGWVLAANTTSSTPLLEVPVGRMTS